MKLDKQSLQASLRHQAINPERTSSLVARHRRYGSSNLADVQARLGGMRDAVHLSVRRPDDFVSYDEVVLMIGKLVLTIGCVDARDGYDLSFRSGDEYIITVPLLGNGWISTGGSFVEYGLDDVVIVSPLCRIEKHWEGPGEVMSLHVPADRLDLVRSGLGLPAFPTSPVLRIDRRRIGSFLRLMGMICDDLLDSEGPSPFLRDRLGEQAEDMLLTLLLEQMREDAPARRADVVQSPAIPYYVRRAEKFIAANAHLSLSIEDVAKAAGVSVRSVQYGFREFLDTTPRQFLKRARYQRAREILLREGSQRRISDIAMEIGCCNISQFSRDYRLLFGETPSETTAVMRGLLS